MFFRALTAAFLLASPAFAAPLALTPADPQPKPSELASGLAVAYAYPGEVRTIQAANSALGKARKGRPLRGLSYQDNNEGDKTLTAKTGTKVAAKITGYIRFDAPGTYKVNVISNDGIQASIGGKEIAFNDGIHGCEPAGVTEVSVPVAGWYALDATYFQRKGTACLEMDWNVGGKTGAVPDTAFAYKK
ncbi:hypothetical protein Z945_2130 [Sulfitobacter noctilucae]|uniref:PA14 domain-containing protein n=1 Tax=Sulfitobacter noctilucae TaxID=1342302 RepID=UPI0004697CFA|nr:PA14 domain-containing protein [Sulfitobacter noctilucae]KIN61145.1 hypothetical protein Z945_2130 [Sulfitobacter noctilucae]